MKRNKIDTKVMFASCCFNIRLCHFSTMSSHIHVIVFTHTNLKLVRFSCLIVSVWNKNRRFYLCFIEPIRFKKYNQFHGWVIFIVDKNITRVIWSKIVFYYFQYIASPQILILENKNVFWGFGFFMLKWVSFPTRLAYLL